MEEMLGDVQAVQRVYTGLAVLRHDMHEPPDHPPRSRLGSLIHSDFPLDLIGMYIYSSLCDLNLIDTIHKRRKKEQLFERLIEIKRQIK